MGDRTQVTLTLLREHYSVAKPLLEKHNGGYQQYIRDDRQKEFISLIYEEVNYGHLLGLFELINLGIAYESRREAGDEYTAATEYGRFDAQGNYIEQTVYDSDINPDIDDLIALCDTPAVLVKFIKNHKEKVTPLPWDNQVEYGKRYQARALIEQRY